MSGMIKLVNLWCFVFVATPWWSRFAVIGSRTAGASVHLINTRVSHGHNNVGFVHFAVGNGADLMQGHSIVGGSQFRRWCGHRQDFDFLHRKGFRYAQTVSVVNRSNIPPKSLKINQLNNDCMKSFPVISTS